MATIKKQALVRLFESEGVDGGKAAMLEDLELGHLKLEDLSVRDLWEASVVDSHGKPCGADLLYEMNPTRGNYDSRRIALIEAKGGVDTSAFSNIIGQYIYTKTKEPFPDPEFIGDELCETVPTLLLDGEKEPGVGAIGDAAQVVAEGDDYPIVGLSEEWFLSPATQKRGFIVPVTREVLLKDINGLILKMAKAVQRALGLNKEKRILDIVFGVLNNYNRNGTAYSTYLTSGAWINQQANTLTDWTSIEKVELLFDAITDPNTGEPITGSIDTVIVPSALRRTGNRILTASEIAHVDNSASSSTIRTWSKNPYSGESYRVISSPYVKLRTGSPSTWFAGRPKRAFEYRQNWGIETLEAPTNSEKEFTADIVQRTRVSERGAAWAAEPRYMTKNT